MNLQGLSMCVGLFVLLIASRGIIYIRICRAHNEPREASVGQVAVPSESNHPTALLAASCARTSRTARCFLGVAIAMWRLCEREIEQRAGNKLPSYNGGLQKATAYFSAFSLIFGCASAVRLHILIENLVPPFRRSLIVLNNDRSLTLFNNDLSSVHINVMRADSTSGRACTGRVERPARFLLSSARLLLFLQH
jgi:hypothetical protein